LGAGRSRPSGGTASRNRSGDGLRRTSSSRLAPKAYRAPSHMRLRLFTASVLRSVLWRVPLFGARMPLRGVGPGAPARPARVLRLLAVGGLGRVLRGSWRGLSESHVRSHSLGWSSGACCSSSTVRRTSWARWLSSSWIWCASLLWVCRSGGVVWPAGLASVCLANIAVSSEQCRGSASEARAHEIAIVATCENRADSFGAGHVGAVVGAQGVFANELARTLG
jgi:hypothetical protein